MLFVPRVASTSQIRFKISQKTPAARRRERGLWMARWRDEGEESTQEEVILDEMEVAWMNLSESEQAC